MAGGGGERGVWVEVISSLGCIFWCRRGERLLYT